jgi:hypothetical protein
MRFFVQLDDEAAERLREMAFREMRRPVAQAIVLLRQGLGLPVPRPPEANEPAVVAHDVVKV